MAQDMPHEGHEAHLCYLVNIAYQQSNPKEYRDLVKDGKFYCKSCGRVAANKQNLCKPVKM